MNSIYYLKYKSHLLDCFLNKSELLVHFFYLLSQLQYLVSQMLIVIDSILGLFFQLNCSHVLEPDLDDLVQLEYRA